MTRRALIPVLVLLAACLPTGGCADLEHSRNADEAKQRWAHMRAKVKLQLAQKSFTHGNVDDALKKCTEVISLDPGLVEGYLLATRIRLERGEIAKAQLALDSAEFAAAPTAEGIYLRGLIAERQGRRDEALGQYAAAYEMAPEELDYLLTYVECLIAQDHYAEALRVVEPRRADFEQTPAVYVLMGHALVFLDRPQEAVDAFQRALALAPDDPLLREEVGMAYQAAGWHDKAVETLKPLLRWSASSPDRPTTQTASSGESSDPEAGLVSGVRRALLKCYVCTDRTRQAEALIREVAQDARDESSLWLFLADALLRNGNLDHAAEAAERANRLIPGQSDAVLLLTYHALESGRATEAIERAERMLQRSPYDVEARALLARAYEEIPNGRAKAAEHYRRILSVVPDHPWAQAQLQRLTQQARAE